MFGAYGENLIFLLWKEPHKSFERNNLIFLKESQVFWEESHISIVEIFSYFFYGVNLKFLLWKESHISFMERISYFFYGKNLTFLFVKEFVTFICLNLQ